MLLYIFLVYVYGLLLICGSCVCVLLSLSPCIRGCVQVYVMWVCWGGLMGSVGARVPGEQLSLIIQTRLIIKAAQISP